MKKHIGFLILIPVVFVLSSFLNTNSIGFTNSGVKANRSDYTLNIVEANIPPLKDTVFDGKKCLITNCPLTLTNNTNDTLKYQGMSASWWDNYDLDNKKFALAAEYWNVFKNGPVVCYLLPNQQVKKNIRILTYYKDNFRNEKLKIAMRIKKVLSLPMVGEVTQIGPESSFVIWSNEVTIH